MTEKQEEAEALTENQKVDTDSDSPEEERSAKHLRNFDTKAHVSTGGYAFQCPKCDVWNVFGIYELEKMDREETECVKCRLNIFDEPTDRYGDKYLVPRGHELIPRKDTEKQLQRKKEDVEKAVGKHKEARETLFRQDREKCGDCKIEDGVLEKQCSFHTGMNWMLSLINDYADEEAFPAVNLEEGEEVEE